MLTSEELNAAIRKLDEDTWGEKPIPYMGFGWRDVDFDTESYGDFGVCNETMEAKGEAWAAIKLAIRVAVTEPSHQHFGVVKDLLQALVPVGAKVVAGKQYRGMTIEWDLVLP